MEIRHLTALLISTSLAVVVSISARHHHQRSAGVATFTFSPVIGYLTLACGVLFLVAPLLAGASGDISDTASLIMFAPFWVGAFVASAFFFRYRVVINQSTLTVVSLYRRVVPFRDIVDLDVIQGQRGSELIVYLKNGRKLRLSGLLGDFADLARMIDSQIPAHPDDRPDSPMKHNDRAARAAGERRARVLLVAGLVLIALAAILSWWIQ
jgi:hypothetical protein